MNHLKVPHPLTVLFINDHSTSCLGENIIAALFDHQVQFALFKNYNKTV